MLHLAEPTAPCTLQEGVDLSGGPPVKLEAHPEPLGGLAWLGLVLHSSVGRYLHLPAPLHPSPGSREGGRLQLGQGPDSHGPMH